MPTVTMPPEYFKRALKDYSDWHFALVREFVQNSADAGASRIDLTFDSATRTVTCKDNGRGASAAVVSGKLLVLGGSHKEGPNTVGGFGLAKELLYFAHERWTIATRDVRVVGSFGSYDLTTGHEPVAGFTATITLDAATVVPTIRHAAARLARLLDRPEVTLTIDGAEYPADAKFQRAGRRAAKVWSWGKAYRVKDTGFSGNLWLRTAGIPTAAEYVGALPDSVGNVFVELTGASSDLLSVSRERLRNDTARSELNAFVRALVTDSRKALDDHDTDEDPVALFFDAEDVVAAVATERRAGGEDVARAHGAGTTAAFMPQALDTATTAGGGTSGRAVVALGDVNVSALARGDLSGATVTGPRKPTITRSDLPNVGTGVKLGVRVSAKGVTAAKRYLTQRQAGGHLAGWATACERIAAAMAQRLDTVGFTFDPTADAEAVTADRRHALFINPEALKRAGTEGLADEIIDLAIHEWAHVLAPGGHHEAWAGAEMRVRRAVRGSDIRFHVKRALRTALVDRPATGGEGE